MISEQAVSLENESLNILFLAPQPFYQERGTPIANDMVLQTLSARKEQIDVVTYSEGLNLDYNGVSWYRIKKLPLVNNIKPGFSWQKIICDFQILIKVLPLVRRKNYHLVHAVEESVFIALILKFLCKIPYVYDMDSSLAEQMVEKYPQLAFMSPLLDYFEGIAVKYSEVVVPVCQSLANRITKYQPQKVEIIPDVSLLKSTSSQKAENLRQQLNIPGQLLMYVGNLESYQGIDLLLESMAYLLQKTDAADLVVIGGKEDKIKFYQQQAVRLGIEQKVHFVGARGTNLLAEYLQQADILVSPRIKGKNTPMKIYSYLDSGKAVVATDLPTHTQVIESGTAILAKADAEEFAQGILCLIRDADLRHQLGIAGKKLIQSKYTPRVFRQKLNNLYDHLQSQLLQSSEEASSREKKLRFDSEQVF